MFLFLISVFSSFDQLAYDKPDKFDLKMAKNDLKIFNFFDEKDQKLNSKIKKTEDAIFKIEDQVETLKRFLNSKNIYPLTSTKLWEIIYDFIKGHLEDFLKNNELSFSIYIRYSFCSFIIPLLPSEYFLIFPSFYKILIPKKFRKNEHILKFIKIFDKFLLRVKARSSREFLPLFNFRKATSIQEDLEFIKEIPKIIISDPVKIIKWLLDFRLNENSLVNEILKK